jgi:uncharacterized protein CbrC (UPF0167 family)
MGEALPRFRYHPDPVATGSVESSAVTCGCCDRVRGHVYTGPVYSEEERDGDICPWCIADGSAHEKFGAEFTDLAGVGDHGSWDKVDPSIAEEVAFRTPGFSGWQQERWFTCCKDAAVFLGPAGYADLMKHGPEVVESIRKELGWDDGKQWQEYLRALSRDGQPTAYLFRCSHCGRVDGYSDFT